MVFHTTECQFFLFAYFMVIFIAALFFYMQKGIFFLPENISFGGRLVVACKIAIYAENVCVCV